MATVGTLVVNLVASTKDFHREMDKSARRVDAFNRHIQNASHRMDQFASGAQRAARTAAIALTALAAAGTLVMKTTADFERGMVRVRAVSQSTAKEFRELEQAALSYAGSTEYTALQVTEGMNFMAMAGFKANQIIAAMPSVLQLATSGMMDLGTAADITTNILTGYGMEVEELSGINDILVSAMTGANVDLRQLGQAFRYVGPVAKAAGIEIETTASIIALMGNAGIQGTMAGTSLRGAISRLLNPTGEAKRIISKLGLTVLDSSGKMRDMVDIVADLEKVGITAAESMALFGQRAGPAMTALIEMGSDSLAEFAQRLKESGGLAERIERQQLNTLSGQLNILKSQFQEAAIILGKDLMPYVRTLVSIAQDLVRGLQGMDKEQRAQIIRWAAMVAAILGGVIAFGLIVKGVALAMKALALFGAVVGFISSPVVITLGLIAAGAALLYTAWTQNWGGIQEKTQAVWDVIKPILDKVGEGIKTAWDWTINFAGNAWKWVIETGIPWLQEHVEPIIKRAIEIVINFIVEAAEAIRRGFETGDWSAAIGIGAEAWKKGVVIALSLSLAAGAGKAILAAIGGIFGNAAGALGQLGVPLAIGAISVAVQLAEAMAEGSFEDFGANLAAALAAGIGIGAFTGSPATGVLAFTIALNLELGKKAKDFLKEKWHFPEAESILDWYGVPEKSLGQSIKEKWNLAKEFIGFHQQGTILPGTTGPDQFLAMLAPGEAVVPSHAVQGGWPAVLEWFREMGVPGFQGGKAPAIGGAMGTELAAVGNWLEGMSETFNIIFSTVKDTFVNFFVWLGEFLIGLAETYFPEQTEAIREFISNMRSKLQGYLDLLDPPPDVDFDEMTRMYARTAPDIAMDTAPWDRLILGIQSNWGAFTDFAKNSWGTVAEFAQNNWETVTTAFQDTIEWFKSPWEEKIEDIKNMFAMMIFEIGDMFTTVGGYLTDTLGKTVEATPIGESMIQGFQEGGIMGAIMGMLTHSKAFATLLEMINPILQILADIAGTILMPALKLLEGPLKLVTGVLKWVAETIVNIWNAIVDLLDRIIFFADLSGWKITLEDMTDEFGKAGDAASKLTESLLGVPQGFKVAMARFEATKVEGTEYIPSAQTGGEVTKTGLVNVHAGEVITPAGGAGIVIENVTIVSNDPEEIWRGLKRVIQRDNVKIGGTMASRAPQYVGGIR